MAETTNVTIRMEKELKEKADAMFSEMGMSISTAVNIFVRQSLRQGKIPFEIYTDPFYSESNIRVLEKRAADMDAGRNLVAMSMDEVNAMQEKRRDKDKGTL